MNKEIPYFTTFDFYLSILLWDEDGTLWQIENIDESDLSLIKEYREKCKVAEEGFAFLWLKLIADDFEVQKKWLHLNVDSFYERDADEPTCKKFLEKTFSIFTGLKAPDQGLLEKYFPKEEQHLFYVETGLVDVKKEIGSNDESATLELFQKRVSDYTDIDPENVGVDRVREHDTFIYLPANISLDDLHTLLALDIGHKPMRARHAQYPSWEELRADLGVVE